MYSCSVDRDRLSRKFPNIFMVSEPMVAMAAATVVATMVLQ
jgi:hypothetical protein